MTSPIPDLNEVITSAVQARIEAEVLHALSSDDTFARFVTAALRQKIDKPGGYGREKTTYLHETLKAAIEEATKQAVVKVVGEMAPQIEDEVAKAMRRDIKGIAGALVGSVDKAVRNPYGMTITLKERGD
jgi:hypothetical protein